MINPIDPFAPSQPILQLLEDLLKLPFGLRNVLLLRVDHQIIILREQRNQRILLDFDAPGQLLEKSKQLILVNGVPLSEAADVNDRV